MPNVTLVCDAKPKCGTTCADIWTRNTRCHIVVAKFGPTNYGVTNSQNAFATVVVTASAVLAETRSCPALCTVTSSVRAGISFNADVSSAIEPKPSRLPCTKSAGVLRFGK